VGQQLVTNHKIGQQPLSTVKTTVIPAHERYTDLRGSFIYKT
jgi:hypothetical protein